MWVTVKHSLLLGNVRFFYVKCRTKTLTLYPNNKGKCQTIKATAKIIKFRLDGFRSNRMLLCSAWSQDSGKVISFSFGPISAVRWDFKIMRWAMCKKNFFFLEYRKRHILLPNLVSNEQHCRSLFSLFFPCLRHFRSAYVTFFHAYVIFDPMFTDFIHKNGNATRGTNNAARKQV